jgi:exosortase A
LSEANVLARQWAWAGALWLLLVVLTLAANPDTFGYVVYIWQSDGAFGHSWLVLAISAWMVWRVRAPLLALPPSPSVRGMLFLAAVMLTWWLAYAVEIRTLQQLALTASVTGITWALLGTRVAWLLAFPLLYLFFTVSAWDVLSVPMQEATAVLSAELVRLLGVPVFRDGPYLLIPEGTFLVDRACAGLRYTMAGLSIGALYAYLSFDDLWRRTFFLGVTLCWALLINVVRVVMVIYAGHVTDMQHAWVDDHGSLGWVVFAAGLPVLFLIGAAMHRMPSLLHLRPIAASGSPAHGSRRRTALAASGLVAIMLIIAPPVGAKWLQGRAAATSVHGSPPEPPAVAGWTGPEAAPTSWGPQFPTADAQISATYASKDGQVHLNLAWYAYERREAKLLYFRNRLFDRNRWLVVGEHVHRFEPNGTVLTLREQVLRPAGGYGTRVVWSWYQADGQTTASPAQAKLLVLRGAFRGRPDALMVALAADGESEVAARDLLQAFLKQLDVP